MYRIREHVDMAQKGIPEKYRVENWMVYSGANAGWALCNASVLFSRSYVLGN